MKIQHLGSRLVYTDRKDTQKQVLCPGNGIGNENGHFQYKLIFGESCFRLDELKLMGKLDVPPLWHFCAANY